MLFVDTNVHRQVYAAPEVLTGRYNTSVSTTFSLPQRVLIVLSKKGVTVQEDSIQSTVILVEFSSTIS